MYYLLVYDISSVKRITKVLKTCRKYLRWIQNSVFEGELTFTQFNRLEAELKQIINKKEDSVIIFCSRNSELVDRQILGIEKNENSFFI